PLVARPRRLAERLRVEAPTVAGVEGRGVDQEDRDGHLVASGRSVLRDDLQVAHADRIRTRLLLLVLPDRVVPGWPVEDLIVELADAVAARVVGSHHIDVLPEAGEGEGAQVLLDPSQKVMLYALHDLDVVCVLDFACRKRLQQILNVEVIERTDDGAARDGGDDLDAAELPDLREVGENPKVKEGGPE